MNSLMFLARKGKAGGGYCDFLPFTNLLLSLPISMASRDIDVLTHECGHAFEAWLTRDMEIYEHTSIGMETAEVHSMSMGFFTGKWMHLFSAMIQVNTCICILPLP